MFVSFSQAGQDAFVNKVLANKQKGTFLDIGSGPAIVTSNTYAFEQMNWKGVCIDFDRQYYQDYLKHRKSPLLLMDVTKMEWQHCLQEYPFLAEIDYLSFDVDDSTIAAINVFPWRKIRATVITIEHDLYRVGPSVQQVIRAKLEQEGYTLVCGDVAVWPGHYFEDWFVDAAKVDKTIIDKYRCDKQLWSDILSR